MSAKADFVRRAKVRKNVVIPSQDGIWLSRLCEKTRLPACRQTSGFRIRTMRDARLGECRDEVSFRCHPTTERTKSARARLPQASRYSGTCGGQARNDYGFWFCRLPLAVPTKPMILHPPPKKNLPIIGKIPPKTADYCGYFILFFVESSKLKTFSPPTERSD